MCATGNRLAFFSKPLRSRSEIAWCSQVTQEKPTSLKCITTLSLLTLWHPGLVSIIEFSEFPQV